jgi:hypothetical protein
MSATATPQERVVETFLAGANVGISGAMSIDGDQIVSFGWYPICRRVGRAVWLRRQMYSEATARQIKKVKAVLIASGFVETGKIDEPNRDKWWVFEKPAHGVHERRTRAGSRPSHD